MAYGEQPSVEKYVQIRNEFPEVEIQVGQFGGLEALFAIQQEIEREGIDPQLVAASLDANEPSIDDLSLHLLQLLVARGRLAQAGPGHIETRRNAISDATVNYLIVTMLEALDWNGECISFPGSLIVLIKEQLCGSNPDLYQKYRARERFVHGASLAGQYFHLTKKRLSVRELAAMAGVGRGTAARWLEDSEFPRWFEHGRKLAAGELKLASRKPRPRS
jgi:hypothetical protein